MKSLILFIALLAPLVSLQAQSLPSSVRSKASAPVKPKATPPAKVKTVYVVKNNDRDGDGLSDAIDDCPDEKGSPKNNGCPEKNASISVPQMIEVAGGSFTMGGTNSNEIPTHSVLVSSFSMAKTETTVAQWRVFCNATGRLMPKVPNWGWIDNYPIVNVSWDEAVAYCNWLTKRTGKYYRLPTEAEWEYAARGGKKSYGYAYAGSDDLNVVGWSTDIYQAHACGLKLCNELGLFDMTGNVWEWCKDWFNETYYGNSPSTNPQGPSTGTNRVLRGGCWGNTASYCRVAYRAYNGPDNRYDYYGFRVVLSQ